MKIGRVFPTFQTDLLYTEHYLAKELKREGHETVFITSDRYMPMWDKYIKRKDGPGYFEFENYNVFRLKSWFPLQKAIFKSPINLLRIIENQHFDILHLYGLGTFTTLQVLLFSMIRGKNFPPIVISDHSDVRTHKREGWHARLFYLFFAFILRILGSCIKAVITFDIKSEELLKKRLKLKGKIFKIIPLGYDQDIYRFNKSIKNTEQQIVFGYAGKIDAKKRVDVLIKILIDSKIANSSKLIVVGSTDDDYNQSLKKIAANAKVEVEFRPFASKEELSDFYNYIDVAVYPGGISITTIEANGCGTPVILYKSIPNLESRIENGRGVLFETEQELERALYHYYRLYQNSDIDNKSIEMATREKYSWNKIKSQYKDIYQKNILNGKRD